VKERTRKFDVVQMKIVVKVKFSKTKVGQPFEPSVKVLNPAWCHSGKKFENWFLEIWEIEIWKVRLILVSSVFCWYLLSFVREIG
jgi:hypothetical protein